MQVKFWYLDFKCMWEASVPVLCYQNITWITHLLLIKSWEYCRYLLTLSLYRHHHLEGFHFKSKLCFLWPSNLPFGSFVMFWPYFNTFRIRNDPILASILQSVFKKYVFLQNDWFFSASLAMICCSEHLGSNNSGGHWWPALRTANRPETGLLSEWRSGSGRLTG